MRTQRKEIAGSSCGPKHMVDPPAKRQTWVRAGLKSWPRGSIARPLLTSCAVSAPEASLSRDCAWARGSRVELASTGAPLVFLGQTVSITKPETDAQGLPVGPAGVCLVSPASRQCYEPPRHDPPFGLDPEAHVVALKSGSRPSSSRSFPRAGGAGTDDCWRCCGSANDVTWRTSCRRICRSQS